MTCNCGRVARLVTGARIYPHRPDLHVKRFYLCEPCNAYVGVHPGTTKALGHLAGPQLRKLRMKAHSVFDPIWKSGRMSRNAAYRWLSESLGFEAHIGQSDEATCEKIIALCQEKAQPGAEGER